MRLGSCGEESSLLIDNMMVVFSWLGDIKEKLRCVQRMPDIAVTLEGMGMWIRKVVNWKAPGQAGVRGFG